MELKDRIAEVRKSFGLTQKDFGEKIGVAANTVTNYESGNRTPLDTVLVSICREFNVSEEWLRTGAGEMFVNLSKDEKILAYTSKLLNGEDTAQKRIISVLLEMTEDECEVWEQFLDKMISLRSK